MDKNNDNGLFIKYSKKEYLYSMIIYIKVKFNDNAYCNITKNKRKKTFTP